MAESHPEASTLPLDPTRIFTSIDRINELSEIDISVAQLLHAAGEALQILGSNSTVNNLSSAKSQFIEPVRTYFTILSSVDVRLRRQVYALQEAGLAAEGDAKDAKRGASAAGAGVAGVAAGGAQSDVSWLNGHGNQVEEDMEREIWSNARVLVDRLLERVDGLERPGGSGEAENGRDGEAGSKRMEGGDGKGQSMNDEG